jgi:membrane fusion protein, multidrug efflux system
MSEQPDVPRTETARTRPALRWLWIACALAAARGAGAERGAVGEAGAARATPVLVAPAIEGDVPIILEGLGTVTPIASVTVKSQIDGRLDSVHFEEGRSVERGQLLAQIDPRPFRIRLQEARATLERDRAALRNAKLDLDRYEQLARERLVSQQQLDTQRAQVDQLAGSLAIDEAAAADAELQLQYTRITAPIDGVVGLRNVHPGNLVRTTDELGLVTLTQFDPISVIFTLPQDELPKVARALAQRAHATSVQVLDRAGAEVLGIGRLTVLDNQVNADTASLRLKAEFDNAERTLWPNQFVKARVEIAVRRGVLSIPAEAIARGPNGDFVYVVTAANAAEQRPVKVEAIESGRALIAQGLTAGERVITDGQDQIKPGGLVQPRAAETLAQRERVAPAKTPKAAPKPIRSERREVEPAAPR